MSILRLTFMFALNSLSKIEYVKKIRFFVISLGRVVIPSPQVVINLPETYENLPC